MSNMSYKHKGALPRFFTLEMFMIAISILTAFVLIWSFTDPAHNLFIISCAGIGFTLSVVVLIRLIMDPDSIRARQTNSMLSLASNTLGAMHETLDMESAQKICSLLLPSTSAIAVAITDKTTILGYAGHQQADNPSGSPLRTQATLKTVKDGKLRTLYTPEEIGLPKNSESSIKAAIIVPLTLNRTVTGTLKFYYRSAGQLSETQKSIAKGFGELLSTQMAALNLEEQTRLATSMELKMLQSQINPHFLFNTINTMASFVRTDPDKARVMLREFAIFYRRTLEEANDLTLLERDLEQVERYFSFEVARFGEDRVELNTQIDPRVAQMEFPSFLIQPLVENSVRHAMPSSGKLSILVSGTVEENDVIVSVSDDGIGMSEKTRQSILHPDSSTGLGIAVKNVNDRVVNYFRPGSHMDVISKEGEGTCVKLILKDAVLDFADPSEKDSEQD